MASFNLEQIRCRNRHSDLTPLQSLTIKAVISPELRPPGYFMYPLQG
jgi:hypothetical protein